MARILLFFAFFVLNPWIHAMDLEAGVAKVDITDHAAGRVHDPSFAKVLFLKQGETRLAIVTLDAVSIGEIGHIGNGFMQGLRKQLQDELSLDPSQLLVNTSHCHGRVRGDVQQLVVQAVKDAAKHLIQVKSGVGIGQEHRISENRRVRLKDGTEADMRRAYPLPSDDEIISIGVIDPQIGIVKLVKQDGSPFAILYQFACHPILNPPSKGSSADYPGEASKVIEEATGAMAFFLQGCGGDINPIHYKETHHLPDAAPLGAMLGSSVLAAAHQIQNFKDAPILLLNEKLQLPRAADYQHRIRKIEAEQQRLLRSINATNLNFKNFLQHYLQQKIDPDHPSHFKTGYLRSRESIEQLDSDNKKSVEAYLKNIEIMEQLTRLQANLSLLKMHQKATEPHLNTPLMVEICALRIGDFKLITFPGELTVEVGLQLKKSLGDPHTFISGYTNGYIYYAATASQRTNLGFAQEDCDARIAPEWQAIFETKATEMARILQR